ncbi:acyltransferase [Ramlibacter ginsenosidimutans]|uniref:Acyltransferase n=1 Tax=Ramlibacter ginsenosidimutans TaxID=502333 RepID=A0A934WMI5_9BURK|nr:acyltransferase [Ramlibacter ginsenosidimutans]
MKHRPEIDGLRAVAVLPVIFYHAGFSAYAGGFVGVDVFFVISGYLITGILLDEKTKGTFSIARFYERRARRILPALFFVLACCIPFALVWLLPADRQDFFRNMAATTLFSSNIYLWKTSSYFSRNADLKPLLHMWSLGVEEQFYLFFPLFLGIAWRFGRRAIVVMLTLAAVGSLLVAQWLALVRPTPAFYLLPPRAWELIVGCLLAFYLEKREAGVPILGTVGLIAIAAAVALYDKTTPFPGFYALVPTLGAAAVIAGAGPRTFAGRLLSARPFVGIGLVSYSAYLWHQPLFAFARNYGVEQSDFPVMFGLTVMSLVLATLSWRFVERPFRSGLSRQWVLRAAAASTASMLAIGAVAASVMPSDVQVEQTADSCNFSASDCFRLPAPRARVALWGDSYADAFAISLARRLAKDNISLHLFIKQSCPSILGTRRNEPHTTGVGFASDCERHNDASVATIQQQKFDSVILTSAYSWYLTGVNTEGRPILLDRDNPSLGPRQFMSARLGQTIDAIAASGSKVILVTPHPTVEDFDRQRHEVLAGRLHAILGDYAQATMVRRTLLSGLDPSKFTEVDGRDLLCQDARCPVVSGGRVLLFDGSHVSTQAAPEFADAIARKIEAGLGSRPKLLQASSAPQLVEFKR